MRGLSHMDIYSYFNSKDVAAHCREIGKEWTAFEMAVIILRSDRPMTDKHAAWRELISDYPDMPTPKCTEYKSFDSLHRKLTEVIDYEESALALLKKPEQGAVYRYEAGHRGDYFPSYSVFKRLVYER